MESDAPELLQPPAYTRDKTRSVSVGSVDMGGGAPVRIQSMWKTPLGGNTGEMLHEIERLASFGCELLRFAVPNTDAVDPLRRVCADSPIPIVADIHFDHRLALSCLDFVHKIRINPGNIVSEKHAESIVKKAADVGVPIRIGINGGSLPHDLRKEPDIAAAMVRAAERELEIFDRFGFSAVVVSLKCTDSKSTVKANRMFADRYDYPLHIGLTEAGPPLRGIVKSSVTLNQILQQGIGDTIRVSLSGSCADEVVAATEILRVSDLSRGGVQIISCPKCARASFDVHEFLEENRWWIDAVRQDITLAVMGCEVNGPEEAKHADVGIAGSGGRGVLFRQGKIVRRMKSEDFGDAFREEVEKLCAERIQ